MINRVEIEIKYEGYIRKARTDAKKLNQMERVLIPEDLDYASMANLANEARQKLAAVRPRTIGQASRISGVNPADLSVLLLQIQRKDKTNAPH